jgi:D-glycero-D-manno-heptose 1,7-bisphosphate phosphatase
MSRAAVFLDRDGVINANVFNPATGAWESPHRPEDFRLADGAIDALKRLKAAGLPWFLVSNQPSYAKGKAPLDMIWAIARRCEEMLAGEGVGFVEAYYCLHHPAGVIEGYSGPCDCRKPSPAVVLAAAQRHGLDLARSWFVGDRDSDVDCGRRAGTRTIRVAADHPVATLAAVQADAEASGLAEAVDIILKASP